LVELSGDRLVNVTQHGVVPVCGVL
jgi:hypothetical protein